MPMGDYSSRDGLDLDLTRSEYEIISLVADLSLRVHLYVRLVDDISIVAQGDFSEVLKLLDVMSERYPAMPLNVQVSYRYSRFLDLHVNNMKDSNSSESYNLVTNLAYKEHSNFAYTPKTSNIHKKYKTAIVPISLHRAFTRCTDMSDTNHHISFMKRMVQSRNQDADEVQRKISKKN